MICGWISNGMVALFTAGIVLAAEPPAAEGKTNKWESSIAAGLTLTRGNSDTLLGNLNYSGIKKWDQNEVRVGLDGSYGENNDVVNNQAVRAFGQYNRLFTERFYGYIRAEGLHDDIAAIDYRFTLGPGVGYYFIKNPKTTLSGEVGPAVVFERQGGRQHSYMTLRFAERLEHRLNDRARLWEAIEFLPQVDDFNNYVVNGEIGVEADLTKTFALRAFVLDTYDNEPAPGRKKNDLKLVTSLVYKF
jgi:putative salt-induced outer membrane protein